MNQTLNYYAENAADFAASTVNVDFSATQERFLSMLPAGASILDFGCGSGRDTKAFLAQGYRVTAADGSPELCREKRVVQDCSLHHYSLSVDLSTQATNLRIFYFPL
ncbi:MAG: methyltransferase domain-containing protein [Anaerolineaceae bacterium]|nr:methyltransferase domain-containing protein [Anaerolineaceae bacterium]MBQ6502282.1 methyltransferase domain-containing protein [Flexilinea sp.]